MNYENLILDKQDEVLLITINRPSKLNALNKQTLNELNSVLTDAENDASIGGLIITGSGEKAFVAGADISEFASYNVDEGKLLAKDGQKNVFDFIDNYPKPIIAAINGFALGGGLELALACHIRIASNNAKFGLPEVTLGLIPGYGGTQRLTQIVGKGKAMEMILTANMINAAEAENYGLVNKITLQQELLPACSEILKTILTRSPEAISAAITSINASSNLLHEGFEIEIEAFGKCFGTENFKEGVSAFLEKRKPLFKRK